MIVRTGGKFSALYSSTLLLLMAATVLATGAMAAQKNNRSPAAPQDIKFEIASITPLKQGMPMGQTFGPTPDGYRSALSVWQMLMLAYAPGNFMTWNSTRLLNAPKWLQDGSWYMIDARVSEADREAWRNQKNKELLRPALQALLRERCKLVIHEVPTQIQVYNLVVRKGGVRLTATPPNFLLPKNDAPLKSGGVRIAENGTRLHYYGATMADLVDFLTLNSAGRPVYDTTGLKGHYNFTLQLTGEPSRDPEQTVYNWPVDQLGLQVKVGKGPGITLVIDYIERPSQN